MDSVQTAAVFDLYDLKKSYQTIDFYHGQYSVTYP